MCWVLWDLEVQGTVKFMGTGYFGIREAGVSLGVYCLSLWQYVWDSEGSRDAGYFGVDGAGYPWV